MIAAAAENLAALSEELESVDLVLASYGVEAEQVRALAYEIANDSAKRLIVALTKGGEPGAIHTEFAANYTAGISMGLALAREIETAHPHSGRSEGS